MAVEQPDDNRTLASEEDLQQFEVSFDALVREHYVRLSRFAFRMVNSWDAAEDAVQEVLLKIWKRRSPISFRDPVAYLYQAVRNECLMTLRRQRRWEESATHPPETLPAPEAESDAELRTAVDQAIAALPERCRLVFTMSREQELSYGEIARLLGISVKTVETQMGRALKSLRRALAGYLGGTMAVLAASGAWPPISL